MKQIPFNQQGEEAILADRKTHTRRLIKKDKYGREVQIRDVDDLFITWHRTIDYCTGIKNFISDVCEYQIGETVELVAFDDNEYFEVPYVFATAIIKDLRVERLQDISEGDCFKEGTPFSINEGRFKCVLTGNPANDYHIPMKSFFRDRVWQPLPYKPPYDWGSNPWVWVIVFEVNTDHGDEWEIEIR